MCPCKPKKCKACQCQLTEDNQCKECNMCKEHCTCKETEEDCTNCQYKADCCK